MLFSPLFGMDFDDATFILFPVAIVVQDESHKSVLFKHRCQLEKPPCFVNSLFWTVLRTEYPYQFGERVSQAGREPRSCITETGRRDTRA